MVPFSPTKDGEVPIYIPETRARWAVKKSATGQPQITLDLYQGSKHIGRMVAHLSDISVCEALSKSLLELQKAEAPNFSKIIKPDLLVPIH